MEHLGDAETVVARGEHGRTLAKDPTYRKPRPFELGLVPRANGPTMDQKWYAGSQVIDEVRHVEVISKFLASKMGVLYPVSPTIKILLDKLLEAPTWKLKTLGMQCLFEGVAVGILDIIKSMTTNPLLKDILRRVELDESRHAAFGILTMRRLVQDATPEEMVQFEEFAFAILEALNANQQMDMLHDLGPKYGLDPEAVVRVTHSLPNWAALNSEVYMHTVVPNLIRLGLITERTESRYRKLGILSDTRTAPTANATVIPSRSPVGTTVVTVAVVAFSASANPRSSRL